VCFGIISRPNFGGRCFLHDGCMVVHGTFCVWMCRSEGGANDGEKWSCIDALKGGKGGKSLMEKFGVELNGGCLGVMEFWGEEEVR